MTTLTVKTFEEYKNLSLDPKVCSQASEIHQIIIKLALINFGMTNEDVNKIPKTIFNTIATAYRMTEGLNANGKRSWSDVGIYRDSDLMKVNKISHNEVDCKRFLIDVRFEQMKSFNTFIEVRENAEIGCESLHLKRGLISHLNILTKEL